MSHNTIKINSQKPDASGNITQTLDNLSDVSISSAANNQVLKYDSSSSAWVNGGALNLGTVFCGEGASQAYSGSSASGVGNGDTVYFYASSPYNSLSATITSSSSWVSQIAIGVGTFKVSALVALTFSSTGSGEYRLYNGSTAFGSVGTYAQDNSDCTNPALGIITVSSGTANINVKLTSAASNINTVANQGNRQSQLGYLIVERLA